MGGLYWPVIETDDKWKYSATPWAVKNLEKFVVGFEEIRTILGSDASMPKYINGDDISENLYRSCVKQPLRFGHSNTTFYEDKAVIDKVKSVCDKSKPQYLIKTTYNGIVDKPLLEDRPKFKYESSVLRQGIGYFRIPQFGIELIEP